MGKKKNLLYKVLIIGPGSVGKTSLLYRFVRNEFKGNYTITMGANFLTKEIKFKKAKVKLQLWDIGGQERFKFLHATYYKMTAGALLCFDLTRYDTYDTMSEWLSEMYDILKEKIPFVLIGNKVDLVEAVGRMIDQDESKEFAESNGGIYIETSAKTGANVEEAFRELARRMAESKGIMIE